MPISNLTNAKKVKNDEFYTQYSDIQKEIEAYLEYKPDVFRDKVVYCNCDDPFESNFFRYFVLNFNKLGLKQLITTSYKPSPVANTKLELFGDDKTLTKSKGRPKVTANKFIINEVRDADGEIPLLCNTLCSMNPMDKAIKGKKKALGKGLLYKTMIDQFIIDLNGFSISDELSNWQTKNKSGFRWQQQFNPSVQDYRKYGYIPNFALTRIPSKFGTGWYTERLTIQASAPKALFGTNYYGIKSKDYEPLIRKLIASCKLVGLPLTSDQIEKGVLREIAFCFNFIFDDKFPYPLEYIKRMDFLDIGKRYDNVKNTDFIETAHGYQGKYYNGQVGWGVYDQRARIMSKGKTQEEMEVAEKMKNGTLPDKILRMEVTYQNQTSVKQHLTTRLGGNKKQPRHLKEVFNNKLAQDVLTDIFDRFTNEVNVTALEMPIIPAETAHRIMSECGMSPAEAMMWIGFSLSVQQTGTLPLKETLDRYYRRQYMR